MLIKAGEAYFLKQFLFAFKMVFAIGHKFIENRVQFFRPFTTGVGIVKLADQVEQGLVVIVDFLDTGGKFVLPHYQAHN